MDISAEVATEAAGGGDSQQTDRPRVRRRLIQSTLFPHKSPDNAAEKDDELGDQEDDGEDEDYCGKRKRNRKPRASKKVAVNGKRILSRRVDGEGSPPIVLYELLKASEGQHQPKEQQCAVSPEGKDKSYSPSKSAAKMKTPRQLKKRVNSTPKKKQTQTTPKKKQTQTTPKKCIMNGGLKDTCPEQIIDYPIQIGSSTQPIPDLRLEERLKAEENRRIFGGRQIHPFFSLQKMAKNSQETTDVERSWSPVERKDSSTSFGPIHVFEKVQDDVGSLDWGNWVLSERKFVSSDCDINTACSPVFEGSVKCLDFDDFLNIYPSRTSLLETEAIQHKVVSLDQPPIQQEYRHVISPIFLADEPAAHYELVKDIEVNRLDHEMDKADFLSAANAGQVRNSDVDWESRFLYERMVPYYHGCGNHPVNSQWTNKYLPEKTIEVCGNEESVNFLSEWLRLWHERDFRSSKDLTVDCNFTVEDDYYNCSQSDHDTESRDEENSLKNVLLVTGPVGSGKSAAIYACAKEQGFHVIEVNASDWRTRTLVMQRFEGAVESYSVQRTLRTPAGSERMCIQKSIPVTSNTMMAQGSDSEVIELIPLSDEDDSQNAMGTPRKFVCKENKTATDQSESKPLIVFEDVDAILSVDHGLIATIQKLARTAKRPIILTSDSHKPFLPNNFDRLELCFTKPSLKELRCHAYMVCAAEKAKIQTCFVDRFIGCCQGDIRKTIMHLQFWCQGRRHKRDNKESKKYGPLLFDLDAGHQILPKIVPWSFPSQLSETVEKIITKSLLMMEESLKLMKVLEEGELNKNKLQNHSKRRKSAKDVLKAKKEAILRKHCPVLEENGFVTQFNTSEFSNSSGSPVAFTRRNLRRKLATVLSSNSGNESLNDQSPVVRGKLFEDIDTEMFLEVDSKTPSCCPATRICFGSESEQLLTSEVEKLEESFNPLFGLLLNSEGEKLPETGSHFSESVLYTQINGTRKSIDISCVPESSFVPETLINDGTLVFSRTVSSGPADNIVEAVSTSNDFIQNKPVETNNHNQNQYVSGLHNNPEMVENFDNCRESAHVEEIGDSHTEHVESVPRGYQVMDECSRVEFSRGAKLKDKPNSRVLTDSVQETWRRIRGYTDLRQCVTLEQKEASQVLKIAYGMSNLISEADILLGDCHPLICDSLEPSMVPFEKSHSFSWFDDQLSMTSTIAQHGLCFYAKEIAVLGSIDGSENRIDLASEMLASSTNTLALGKLVSQDMGSETSEMGPLTSPVSVKSELESHLCSIVQSIVPPRLHLATKGGAFHEYLSSLGQISRSEAFRLSEQNNQATQKRVRVARNYLGTSALMLSPEDISLLGQYNCYGKVSCKSTDTSLR